jgi:hypothetical protein
MDWATWALVLVSVLGAMIGVSVKLGSLTTRVETLESGRRAMDDKLDAIIESLGYTKNSLSRIEGAMETHLHERN